MENTTQNGAPLTRRQAREIERRTGVRPLAGAQAGSSFRSEDTGRIERNEVTSLVSVVPTQMLRQISAEAGAGSAVPAAADRGLTVRAPRPVQLVVQRRRRVAGGFAAAASVTALAAVGLTSLAGHGGAAAPKEHKADLLAAANSDASEATQQSATPEAAAQQRQAALQAAAQAVPAAESAEATQVAAIDSSAVSAVAVSAESASSAGRAVPGVAIPATGTIQEKMLAYVDGMLGSYGMDCTDYVQNALGAAGLVTPRLQGGPDLGVSSFTRFGTPIDPSQAQPGDIMIKYGYHVSIYAGGGKAYHGGWNGAADDNVLSSYQASPYFYDVIIRVTG